jgi:hypothetical protein
MTATTYNVRKAIPLKFVVTLVLTIAVVFAGMLAYFSLEVRAMIFSGIALIIQSVLAFVGWMIIPQALIAGIGILLITVLLTQRKYIFKKKVTVITSPTVAPLQSQLQQPVLQPTITQEEVEKA